MAVDNLQLGKLAIEAKKNASPKYSHFHVGAALLAEDGTIIQGCNVESDSYGLTICAERNAIFKAISDGHRKFKALAIASDFEGFTSPCGACRQIIWEYCGNVDVVMINHKDELQIIKAADLLPYAFTSEALDNK
jgi:cytidine deaminase